MENETSGRETLFVLDGWNRKILAFSTDGSSNSVVLENCGGTPDGIALDADKRHIYWTNMGNHYDQNDGYIERVDFDGSNRKIIIPPGTTFTPKQIKLDLENGLMYWCDREGMRVMRAQLDGSNITTLVQTGHTVSDQLDQTNHCVGIALDTKNGYLYWTQKGPSKGGKGRIFRAGLQIPENEDPAYREDLELLWENLPEPIDLDLNVQTGELYWTDRGAEPKGNSLNRASVNAGVFSEPEILCTGLQEAIGLALDIKNNRVFYGDLGGNLYCRKMYADMCCYFFSGEGKFTGIAFLAEGL